MAGVEELLVFKAMAARSRDIDDAVTLLTLYPHIDLNRVRGRIATLADLAEAPELMSGLERIVRAVAAKPPSPVVRPRAAGPQGTNRRRAQRPRAASRPKNKRPPR